MVTIEVARKQAARVVAAGTIVQVEVRPPKCKTCNARLRIGNAVPRKASASSKPPAVAVAAVGADAEAVVAGGAAKRWHPSMNESYEPQYNLTCNRQLTPNHAPIMLPVA